MDAQNYYENLCAVKDLVIAGYSVQNFNKIAQDNFPIVFLHFKENKNLKIISDVIPHLYGEAELEVSLLESSGLDYFDYNEFHTILIDEFIIKRIQFLVFKEKEFLGVRKHICQLEFISINNKELSIGVFRNDLNGNIEFSATGDLYIQKFCLQKPDKNFDTIVIN